MVELRLTPISRCYPLSLAEILPIVLTKWHLILSGCDSEYLNKFTSSVQMIGGYPCLTGSISMYSMGFDMRKVLQCMLLSRRLSSAAQKMTKTALVILANGAEEMEAVITADVLVRGGVKVTLAGLESDAPVVCSRGVRLLPDTSLATATAGGARFDALVLPGGLKGADALAASAAVGQLLKAQQSSKGVIAAICAAPIALKAHQIACGKKLTSHPSVKAQLEGSYEYSESRVVQDGELLTSRGPGTAMEFGLRLVEMLQGIEQRRAIMPPMMLHFSD